MRRYAIVCALLVLVAACATVPKSVDIPVAVPCPAPPRVARQHLPITDLRPGDSPDNVIRAYAVSVEELVGYAEELETILDGYRQ